MSVLALASQISSEDKKMLIGAGLGLINSAPLIALASAMVVNLQWNLEHLAIQKKADYPAATGSFPSGKPKYKYSLVRLDTVTAADVDHKDPNKTPLAPPLMSSAARLADNGLDVAASAARLAEKSIENTSKGGAIDAIFKFWFGG